MIMVCIILNEEEYVDDLLAVLMELEITGATIDVVLGSPSVNISPSEAIHQLTSVGSASKC